ncbi:MAG TPA: FAD-binding oxidoreductase [Burkholderiaceae bacterium]|nr:FAD-binding oxidoreductase [Burkholderiaceae bacterium]HNG79749.1 FAD-binding oxidoreductase [Burkholderiaceae bacterium]
MSAPTLQADVVIVGAGIAGASLAWRLAAHPRRPSVLLLEREAQPGYHSSGRSAAMFMASYGPPGVRALTRASEAFYRDPPPELAMGRVMTPRGVIYLAAPEQLDALARLRSELSGSCPGLRQLAAAEILAALPCLRPERVAAGLLDPDAQDLDVHALLQGFLRGLRAAGGTLRCDAELVAAEPEPGRGWRLTLADGTPMRAGSLVNAAGAWADAVAALCGAPPVGLQPKRRSAFTFDAPAGVDVSAWPLVVDVDERWYLKPDAGRLLGSPANADDCAPQDVRPEELDIALGIDAIQTATTLQIRRPTATWAGLRSFAPDGELLIGWDRACPDLFWCAGQGGYGIQSAAGASALAAALWLGELLPTSLAAEGVDPAAFDPRRRA